MATLDRLRALPKAELHQHIDGSVRPETAVDLAAGIGLSLDLGEARARLIGPDRCASQADLLAYFDLPIALLQTADALERVTAELVADVAADGVTYAELRWAPRLHVERGLSVGDVIEAVALGAERGARAVDGVVPVIALVVTAMRSHPPAANVELARTAAAFGAPVVGFDLAGPEDAWPAPPHAAAFNAAAEGGLELTCHAGEVAGPDRVREVLAFGVARVAHGAVAVDDDGLIEELRRRDVALDLCPTSNVQAGLIADLAEHPIARLHRAGITVTLSTDDRTVTGTTLTDEYARTAAAVGLAPAEMRDIALNGFRRGFAPEALRAPLIQAAAQAWDAWLNQPGR